MEWVENNARRAARPRPSAALLEKAIAMMPGPALHAELGHARLRARDHAGAAAAYAEAERLNPASFDCWPMYAEALLKIRENEAALAVCRRGLDAGACGSLRHFSSAALRRLGRHDEARAELERALVARDDQYHTLRALLVPLARGGDGQALLDYCDRLPEPYRSSAGARGFRAIALSKLGRVDEARALVDVDRHVVRIPFEPPSEFGGIEAFNRMIADEVLRDPPAAPRREGFEINYSPCVGDSPAFRALTAFTRAATEDYIARRHQIGAGDALPPPPGRGSLARTTVVLRRDGSNGEHLHAGNYLASIYYVQVPRSVRDSDDHRGALLLGGSSFTAGDHAPCWGNRHIKPEAGMLTLFPAHMLHDVVPSRSDDPRIVVTGDLTPEPGA